MSRQAFGVLLKGISAVFMAPNWNADRCGSGQETKAFTALMPMHTQEVYLYISQTTIQFSTPTQTHWSHLKLKYIRKATPC